jgi:hypothetical protein
VNGVTANGESCELRFDTHQALAGTPHHTARPARLQRRSCRARAALRQSGIDVADEICAQVTLPAILCFVLHGGLEPQTIAYLRETMVIHDPQTRN